jgi:CHRD domain
MTRVRLALGIALLGVVMTVSAAALAGGGGKTKAKLSGFQEVPAVLTDGNGKLKLRISNTEDKIDFELRYADLEGGNVLFAHIHIGQRAANGAVAAFLCGGGGKPACPPSGTVTGTILPTDVVPVTAQGINEFDDLVEAIRSGITYANVHTTDSPGGEIRGQIGDKRGHRKHDDH